MKTVKYSGYQSILDIEANNYPEKLEFFKWGDVKWGDVLDKAPDIINGVGSVIQGIGAFGGGPKEDTSTVGYDRFMQQRAIQEQQERSAALAAAEKKNTIIWIIAGVITLTVIIGGTFLLIRNYKK